MSMIGMDSLPFFGVHIKRFDSTQSCIQFFDDSLVRSANTFLFIYFQHPQFHDLESKAVRCFCAEDLKTMQRWVVGIRLAKVS